MNAIKQARRLIERNPENADVQVLARLVLALESERPFELAALYELDLGTFEIAIEILKEWRLDRYYVRKARLLDLSMQVSELNG